MLCHSHKPDEQALGLHLIRHRNLAAVGGYRTHRSRGRTIPIDDGDARPERSQ